MNIMRTEKQNPLLLLMLLVCIVHTCTVPEQQYNALEDLYYATNGPVWIKNTGWLQNDACQWSGVKCDSHCNIMYLDLALNNLQGYIPNSISQLSALKDLYLNGNALYGTIPESILYNITSLTYLYLKDNFLNGTFPIMPPSNDNLAFTATNNSFSCPLPSWCSATNESQYCINAEQGNWGGCCAPCIGNSNVYISEMGFDSVSCGTQEDPCATVTYAASMCSSTSTIFYLENGTYYTGQIAFNPYTDNIAIVGSNRNFVTLICDLQLANEYLILFPGGAKYISILNMTFEACVYSIFAINSGNFLMEETAFINNSPQENPLIIFNTKNATVSHCNFINNTGIIAVQDCEKNRAFCSLSVRESNFVGNNFGNLTGVAVQLNSEKTSVCMISISNSVFTNNSGWGYEGCVGYIGSGVFWNSSVDCNTNNSVVTMTYPNSIRYFIEISNSNFGNNQVHCAMCSSVQMISNQIRDGENATFWIAPIDYCGNQFNSTETIPEAFGIYFSIFNASIRAKAVESIYVLEISFNQTSSSVYSIPTIDEALVENVTPSYFGLVSGITDPNTTIAYGPNLSKLSIFCGNATGTIYIQAKDAYGNNETQEIDIFYLYINAENEAVTEGIVSPVNINSFDGLYMGQYELLQTGIYEMSILLNDTWPIYGSPFSTLVIGPSANYSYINSSSSTATAGESFVIWINYFSDINLPLPGSCEGCSSCTNISVAGDITISFYNSEILCISDTVASVNITIFTAATCNIIVSINDMILSPFLVNVAPSTPYPNTSYAFGPLLLGNITANIGVAVNVQPEDRWGNICNCDSTILPVLTAISGDVPIQTILLTCISDTIYSGTVTFSTVGNYSVTITMQGLPVPNGTFTVSVSAEPVAQPLCDATCIILVVFGCLIGLIFFILFLGLCYFIYKKIQRYRRMNRVIPSILQGKPLPTIMEILNDPDIPVLPKDEIVLGKIIGSGAQGMVWKGTNTKTNETVAVKQLHIGGMNSDELQVFLSEIKLTSLLDHRNICPFIGVIILSDGELGMVSKFMERGTLRSLMYEKGSNIPLDMRLDFLVDIARGVKYLHSMKLIHRDLKPDNILIDHDWTAVITDFGCTTVLVDKYRTQTLVGTPIYIAPELLKEEKSNEKVDIYSLGVIINEVILMQEPYSSEWYKNLSNNELINLVIAGEARPEIDSNYHPQLVVLLEECWSMKSEDRPSAAEVKRRLKRLHSNNLFQGWNVPKTAIQSSSARAQSMPEAQRKQEQIDNAPQEDVNNHRAATHPGWSLKTNQTVFEMEPFYGTS